MPIAYTHPSPFLFSGGHSIPSLLWGGCKSKAKAGMAAASAAPRGGGGGVGVCWSPNNQHRNHHFRFFCSDRSPLLLCPLFTIRNEHALSSSTALLSSSFTTRASAMAPENLMAFTLEEERQAARVERLWQRFFSDPSQWWDKRFDKSNPEAPDFKHKTTKQALWINDRFGPSWLQAKLSALTQQAPQQLSSSSSSIQGRKKTETVVDTSQASRTKQLWEEFFSDPSQWWDNRSDKVKLQKSATFPDFKHKTAKKALWIHNSFNPPWIHARLTAMVQGQEQGQLGISTSDMSSGVVRMEQLWHEFFSDPSQWWDNRLIKRSPKYPDFKHKSTHEGLWIEGWMNPPWVKAKMATMALVQKQFGGQLRSRFHDSFGRDGKVSKLCQEGQMKEALHMVELMVRQNIQVPINTYACLLKGCTRQKALAKGKQVHALIVQSGLDTDIFLGSTLVDMYSKCGSVLDARKVFDTLPVRTVFSWTAIISAYADHGQGEEAIHLFHQMQQTGVPPDKVAFVVVLKACARIADLEQGKQLHSHIIKTGFESDVTVGSALVDMYAKCGCIADACEVFSKMSERDVVSWNVMIAGYAQQGLGKKALALYEQMKQEDVQPTSATFVVLLKACAGIAALEEGKQLHSDIIKSGFESDVMVGSTLVDMYAKCGCIEDAHEVFIKINKRNVVSWTSMIAGYAQQGLGKKALALYEQMKQEGVQPDNVIYVVLLKACASIEALEQGKQLHFQIIRNGFETDLIVGSSLVEMYIKCGCIEHARQVFNNMHERNAILWNSMIAGYSPQGLGKEALALYEQMKKEGVQANDVTFVILLKACASIAALEHGKQLHSQIIKSGFESDVIVGSALVDMYAKCGCIENACQVFNEMHERDVVSWNAMIAGCAQQGLGKEALTLLEQMQREGTNPNESTYISVLSACSRSGLVDEGRYLFDSMCKDHGVTPTVDHYACMVDLLCRAGCVADAEAFINKMPIQPNAVVWMTLLSAARNRGHVEIGRRAFDVVVKLEPENAAAYVLLSNIYAAAGRKNEVANLTKKMKDAGVNNAWVKLD